MKPSHLFKHSTVCGRSSPTIAKNSTNLSFVCPRQYHFSPTSHQKRYIFQRILSAFSSSGAERTPQNQEMQRNPKSAAPTTNPNTASPTNASGKMDARPNLFRERNAPVHLPNIKNIIAVASGKGGVGKSTVASNLALSMAQRHGMRVGVLDADVYGPSLHKMFNLPEDSARVDPETNKLEPMTNYGIKCMSMGILTKSDQAAIWRGPMVMGAIRQMLTEVEWGDLDLLVIDMPPGTGDAQLTLTQHLRLTGAVIVSTPQDIALIDVVRGIKMFEEVNVPIVGILENMSYFQCEDCKRLDKKRYIFGKSGARNKAHEMGISFLGEVPIEETLPANSDQGKPLVVLDKESTASRSFFELSDQVKDFLKQSTGDVERNAGPKIVFED